MLESLCRTRTHICTCVRVYASRFEVLNKIIQGLESLRKTCFFPLLKDLKIPTKKKKKKMKTHNQFITFKTNELGP